MENLKKEVDDFIASLNGSLNKLNFSENLSQQEKLKNEAQEPDFWSNRAKAQQIMSNLAKLDQRLEPWVKLKKEAEDLAELSKLVDKDSETEIRSDLEKLKLKLSSLQKELKYSGPYDQHDAFLSIYAGAGGTDAQDWTQMLFRMYSRWAEKQGYKLSVVQESPGEEAGLKSVTCQVRGPAAYGKLRGENGVHRLVRLSPFNADNLRQTSFAKVEVLPEIDQPEEVVIDEKDLKIDVFRSGGKGGQGVNTTDSAVRITHLPTGISVSIQNERSQLQNKETAMTIIRSKIAAQMLEQHKEKISELKGEPAANEWGSQIRNYVLHPYKQVKDLRTKVETSDVDGVLDGQIDMFLEAGDTNI